MSDKKDFQAEIKDSAHKIWLAGLGALSAAEEEGSKLFNNLVERGEGFEKRGRSRYGDVKSSVEEAAEKAKDRVESTWEKVEGKLDEAVVAALGRLGVPSRDEIATLTQRVEELTAVVEQLKPAKKTTAKTSARTAAN